MLKLPGLAPLIACESILYLAGHTSYTWIHFVDRPKYLLAETLQRVGERLPGFIRIHQSSSINPAHVVHVSEEGPRSLFIHLTNGLKLPVARRRIGLVRQQLEAHHLPLIKY